MIFSDGYKNVLFYVYLMISSLVEPTRLATISKLSMFFFEVFLATQFGVCKCFEQRCHSNQDIANEIKFDVQDTAGHCLTWVYIGWILVGVVF